MRRFPILSYVSRASAFLNLSWKSAKEHFSLVVGISYVGAANDCAFMSRYSLGISLLIGKGQLDFVPQSGLS